jgi:hypothetical protein
VGEDWPKELKKSLPYRHSEERSDEESLLGLDSKKREIPLPQGEIGMTALLISLQSAKKAQLKNILEIIRTTGDPENVVPRKVETAGTPRPAPGNRSQLYASRLP